MKTCKNCGIKIYGKQRKYCVVCKRIIHLNQMKDNYKKNKNEWLSKNGRYVRNDQRCLGRVSGENHWNYGIHDSNETKKKKSISKIGKNNPAWLGGLSFGEYCPKFNNQLKTKIRNQYNNCDYISGLHKDVCNNGKNLSVHHVNYDKDCGCNGVKCELIPLSNSNHTKTNSNRPFWNKLFIYSLEIDKWYYGMNEIF